MDAQTLEIVGAMSDALEDRYGKRPSRYILELTHGERVGGAIDDLITLARAGWATATLDWADELDPLGDKAAARLGLRAAVLDPHGPAGGWPIIRFDGPQEGIATLLLQYHNESPSYDDVEEVFLDGTGRNGDPRFPYSWADVAAARAEVARLRGMGFREDFILAQMTDTRYRYPGHPKHRPFVAPPVGPDDSGTLTF